MRRRASSGDKIVATRASAKVLANRARSLAGQNQVSRGRGRGIHPKTSALVEPLDRRFGKPRAFGVERQHTFVDDRDHASESKNSENLMNGFVKPARLKMFEDFDREHGVERFVGERQ